jgi:hypothetical protein
VFKLILILSKTTKPFLEPENNMSSEEEEKPNLESNSLGSKDFHEEQTSLNSTVLANSTLSQVPDGIDTFNEIEQLKQAYFFRNLLFAVSMILVAGTAIFSIDLSPSVALGCGVIGFNYFWTMQFVRKLLQERKLQALDLLFSFTKFGISVIILFVAMQYFDFSAEGLLIGLSNIAVAVLIYSFIRVMRPQ